MRGKLQHSTGLSKSTRNNYWFELLGGSEIGILLKLNGWTLKKMTCLDSGNNIIELFSSTKDTGLLENDFLFQELRLFKQ